MRRVCVTSLSVTKSVRASFPNFRRVDIALMPGGTYCVIVQFLNKLSLFGLITASFVLSSTQLAGSLHKDVPYFRGALMSKQTCSS